MKSGDIDMMKLILSMAAFVGCIAMGMMLFSLSANAKTNTLMLTGKVKGEKVPDGSARLAFSFYDKDSRNLVHHTEATASIQNGHYTASMEAGSLETGEAYDVVVGLPSANELNQEGFFGMQDEAIGIVILQANTPGIQQVGHIHISGTLIAGTIQTGAFRMATGASAGHVLTSDASGVGTWQALPPPSGAAGGDLAGTYPNPTVAGLQTRPVDPTAPASGQVLKWTGTMWAPGADGLTLPFSATTNFPGTLFFITNTATSGSSAAVGGRSASTSGRGVFGWASATSGTTYGGYFECASTEGRGVLGHVTATSGATYGVWGLSDSANGRGVFGLATSASGTNYGVFGQTNSASGTGVLGFATANGTNYGVYGQSNSASGTGVYGFAPYPSGVNYGVYGKSDSESGTGVFGLASATNGMNYGGYFVSEGSNGFGVRARALSTTGVTFGGWFESDSTTGRGVLGVAHASSGSTYGGFFQSKSPSGVGLYGWASATTGATPGVQGQSDSTDGRGVYGYAPATSGITFGGYFQSASTTGTGVAGYALSTIGGCWGVYGSTASLASNAYGVRGDEPSGGAGHAVYANGSFAATGTKSFQIDHPLFPETHYLNHFCTEGPDPMNAYSGNVVTDAKGYATIQLPDYFESINRDFRYQLTVVDDGEREDFVLVKVVRKIRNNQFTIRTSAPHVEVSWRVEAIRNDRWVQKYGYKTEQEKEDSIKGKYVQPELYGMPKEYGIHYHPDTESSRIEARKEPASRGSASRARAPKRGSP